MIAEVVIFLLGFCTALVVVVVLVLALFRYGKGRAGEGLAEERKRLRGLQATLDSSAPTLKAEWRSCSGVSLEAGGETQKVTLRTTLPILFVLNGEEENRVATILLERCSVKLLRRKKIQKNSDIIRYKHRYHCDNSLVITAKTASEVLYTTAEGVEVFTATFTFPLNRELERWLGIFQQGSSFSSPVESLIHPQNEPIARKGLVWRNALQSLQHDMTMLLPGKGQTDVCVNVILAKLLNFWRTREAFTDYIKKKINKQLDKVEKPKAVRGQIMVNNVEIGSTVPCLSNAAYFADCTAATAPEASTPQSGGDFAVEVDVNYTNGEFAVTLELNLDINVGVLDLNIPLPKVLARVQVTGLTGRLRIEMSSFSDYMWISFVEEPELTLKLTTDTPDLPLRILSGADIPSLTELVVTVLKKELIELIVYPNMEDLFIPLINEVEEEDETIVMFEGEVVEEKEEKVENVTPISTPLSAPSSFGQVDDVRQRREIKEVGKTKVNVKDLLSKAKFTSKTPPIQPKVVPPPAAAAASAASATPTQAANDPPQATPPVTPPTAIYQQQQWSAQPQWGAETATPDLPKQETPEQGTTVEEDVVDQVDRVEGEGEGEGEEEAQPDMAELTSMLQSVMTNEVCKEGWGVRGGRRAGDGDGQRF